MYANRFSLTNVKTFVSLVFRLNIPLFLVITFILAGLMWFSPKAIPSLAQEPTPIPLKRDMPKPISATTVFTGDTFSDIPPEELARFLDSAAAAGNPVPLDPIANWFTGEGDATRSIAWGDMDGDGDLDLAAGNSNEQPNKVYLNDNGVLQATAVWESRDTDSTQSIAWGDVDGDGDLDLAVGNALGNENKIYLNDGGSLQTSPAWSSGDGFSTYGIALGDIDGDYDLDLVAGNWNESNVIYFNDGSGNFYSGLLNCDGSTWWQWGAPSIVGPPVAHSGSLLWGVNLSGNYFNNLNDFITSPDIDLRAYAGQTFTLGWYEWLDVEDFWDYAAVEVSKDGGQTWAWLYWNYGTIGSWTYRSIALDSSYAVKNFRVRYRLRSNSSNTQAGYYIDDVSINASVSGDVYSQTFEINNGGYGPHLPNNVQCFGNPVDITRDVALGDVDSDGDLDIAAANDGDPNEVYQNDNGGLQFSLVWTDSIANSTQSVAWGDMNGDGDLDLAVGNYGQANEVYVNLGASLDTAVAWSDFFTDSTLSLAWGDVDSDGDLDLAVGNGQSGYIGSPNNVYLNEGGTLEAAASWESSDSDVTYSVAFGDVNGDGDLDLATGNWYSPNKYHANMGGGLAGDTPWVAAGSNPTWDTAWGDMDGDGDLDLAIGNDGEPNVVYLNQNGVLQSASPAWTDSITDATRGIAWGDVDGDGDLDLAVANNNEPNKIYLNNGATLAGSPVWVSNDSDGNWSLAWGDADGDGDLDLAVAGRFAPEKIYRNDNGTLQTTASTAWSLGQNDRTLDLAWGDVDGDGDLDLAVAIWRGPNKLYLNEGGMFQLAWTDDRTDDTQSVAWGDVDGDGDLDLAVGNGSFPSSNPNKIYLNENGMLQSTPAWESYDSDSTLKVAWGDADGDGDLDLAVGNQSAPNKVYFNEGGMLRNVAGWQSYDSDLTRSVAWGDVDGDGDLDLAAGNGEANFEFNKVYINGRPAPAPYTGQTASIGIDLRSDPVATFNNQTSTALAPANFYAAPGLRASGAIPISYTLSRPPGQPIREVQGYFSLDGGDNWQHAVAAGGAPTNTFSVDAICSSPNAIIPDDDSGGVIDTIVVTDAGSIADLNVFVKATHNWVGDLAFTLEHVDTGTSVTIIDQPGVPEPPVGLGCFRDNINAILDDEAALPVEDECAGAIPTIDGSFIPNNPLNAFDGENINGTWRLTAADLSAGDEGTLDTWCLLPNSSANLISAHVYTWDVLESGFFGQSDNVVFRLVAFPELGPQQKGAAGPYQQPYVAAQTFPFRVRGSQVRVFSETVTAENKAEGALVYRLGAGQAAGGQPFSRDTGQPFRTDSEGYLRGRGQINRGDRLLALTPATESVCTAYYSNDVPLLIPDDEIASVSSYLNIGESGSILDVNVLSISGTHTWISDLDFNLTSPEGTSVQVMAPSCGSDDNFNIGLDDEAPPGAWPCPPTDGNTYQPSNPLSAFDGEDAAGAWGLTINDDFFFDGGELQQWGLEICATQGNIFYTNGAPTPAGVNAYTVTNLGVQTLTVSSQNPLMLINVAVALEWDAHSDTTYLDQLAFDLERASGFIYDFTDGQAALGDVTVTQNGDNWSSSHVVVHATNSMRPFAAQGGIVLTATVDPDHEDIVYDVGQVTMGATWNRYGNAGQSLGEDWPLILAHELSHYLFFLDDTYLGLDDDGLLISIDTCTGSAMGDVYAPANTEFVFDPAHWTDEVNGCGKTLTQKTLSRSEWQNINLWYSELNIPGALNEGPTLMPYNFTNVTVIGPLSPTNALEDPTFYLDYQNSAAATSEARAFLLRSADADDSDFEYIIDLGSPIGGQNRLSARGGGPGDRLCVFDPPHNQYTCEIIQPGDDRLAMAYDPTWTPLVQLSPVTSKTFTLKVDTLAAGLTLKARLYPEYGFGSGVITLTEVSGFYSGTFNLEFPALAGHVQVWVDEVANPRREAIVAYSIGGNPGFTRGGGGFTRGGGGFTRGGGGFTRGGGGFTRGGGGFTRGGGAPLLSPDGQLTFFTENPIDFQVGEFYTIQNMAGLPTLPGNPGEITTIGQGYSLVGTEGAPLIDNASVTYQYLGNDVLIANVDEQDLTIHFWNGNSWEALDTTVNTYFNLASAPSKGMGIYALLGGVTTPQVTAINPLIATNDITTTLTFTGLNFLAPVKVRFEGATTTTTVFTLTAHTVSANTAQVDVPAGKPAQEYGLVMLNGGTEATQMIDSFSLFEPYPGACFYDFFASGANKWSLSGLWDVVTLSGGDQAITDSPDANYNSSVISGTKTSTQITSMPFDLSGCANPLLIVKHDYHLANISGSQDRAHIEISTDGGANWEKLKAYTGGGIYGAYFLRPEGISAEWDDVDWKTAELGLAAYSGMVQLRLRLEVDEDVSDKGWVIDEVVVISGSPRSADLGISISRAGSGIVFAGSRTAVSVMVDNIGPSTVDAVVKGVFPPGAASVAPGTEPCGGDSAILCSFDDLTQTQTAIVWLNTTPGYSGTITATAAISSTYPYYTEFNMGNNQSSVVIHIVKPAATIYLPLIRK